MTTSSSLDAKLLGYVSLKSHFDKYLCCEYLILGEFLIWDRIKIEAWEIFELYADKGLYSLRSHNGKWVCVYENQLRCENYFSNRCKFRLQVIEKHDDFAYKISLQSYTGFWVSANRSIPGLKEHCRDWEHFTLQVEPNLPRSDEITNLNFYCQPNEAKTTKEPDRVKPESTNDNPPEAVSCQTSPQKSSLATQTDYSSILERQQSPALTVIPLDDTVSAMSEDDFEKI
eukprot:NODE_195_length_15388_cov_0.563926.p5 type:complete len:229 gc:universal NODE_195_length_15388_cov_0.563926:9524-8838(-)